MSASTTSAPVASPAAAAARGTFPAGSALALLGLSFAITRVMAPLVRMHPALGSVAVFAGSAGAVLAAVATVITALEGRHEGSVGAVFAYVRAVLALLVALLVASALYFREPPPAVQWAGFVGTAATVVFSLGLAIVRARRGMYAAAGALLALLVGELVELVATPVLVMAPEGSHAITWVTRLAPLAELCAFAGAALALLWAVRATVRAAGAQRTRLFAPMAAFVAAALSVLAASIPAHLARGFAHVAFGTRFDLALPADRSTELTLPVVLLYLLIPEALIAASTLSVAGILLDRGASARRALGWMAVLLAGFSSLRLAGPMDPIRLVTLTLAALLLERAVAIESVERRAPG